MKIKKKYPIYVSKKCCEEKHVDLLLIGKKVQIHACIIILYTFHHRKKTFLSLLCSTKETFSTKEMLKRYIKDFFKINGKQKIIKLEKAEYVKFNNCKRK